MTSQRTWNRIIGMVVLFVLMIAIGISLISASPAEAKEAPVVSQKEDQIEALTRQVEALTALLEQQTNQDEHVLILQIELTTLGGSVTLSNDLLRVAVDQRFFDSCNKGDDVTNSPWVQHISESPMGQIRLIVAEKFTIPH